MSFEGAMAYGDYLKLDRILDAQAPLSSAHDEMLFIIQHQTSELWMKLALHELEAVRRAIRADDMPTALKMMARVSRIFEHLNNAWDILRTMTPSEYTRFRDDLGQSSGFQSWQYRSIEFISGNKAAALLKPHAHRPDVVADLKRRLAEPSLYDEAIRLLARSGLVIAPEALERDWTQPYRADDSVRAAWGEVYRNPEAMWGLYDLAEKLVDFEDYFRRWRFNHVTTVERVIGFKRGTGGTSGVAYLRKMLEVVLFPELWDVRTAL
ncbi:tryptophan 2,3-dioxygenase [Pikeienuella piscinae]|uniref:Tryptophan 2,3-dioxygenase n=2 Tax=Pikeienuella piscinae TaxID=2748098 RepID=A0A7M3T7F6_9RHOB|nr:tryptophan 2,3-dioxygenase [Pikeienuella piscinae]